MEILATAHFNQKRRAGVNREHRLNELDGRTAESLEFSLVNIFRARSFKVIG